MDKFHVGMLPENSIPINTDQNINFAPVPIIVKKVNNPDAVTAKETLYNRSRDTQEINAKNFPILRGF